MHLVRAMHFASTLDAPRPAPQFWRMLWLRVAFWGALLLTVYFGIWELTERTLAPTADHVRVLHLVRGVGGALLLGTWSFLTIRQSRVAGDACLDARMNLLEERVRERTRDLEEARAFTELLFNSLRECIVVTDRSGAVVKANRVALENGGPSGEGRAWEIETIPVPDDTGAPRYVISVGRDITEQRNLEAQVRHQEKMASLGMLAAGFAHDLGNPLASLSTELELLEGEEDVARYRESLDVLRRHVSRMNRTLREMVDFARRRRDEITDVSIASAIADSARLICHDPGWKRVQIVVDVPPDLPPVRMVEDHLVLVLVNLMLNAADAMPNGGTLTIVARKREEGVELHVRDTGVGMTPDVLAKALTPLFTTKGAGRGTGLGLPVSHRIVTSVAGTLHLESAPGVGTDVTIYLPTRRADG